MSAFSPAKNRAVGGTALSPTTKDWKFTNITSQPRSKRIPDEDWERHREEICHHYWKEGKSVEDVRSIMERKHNFCASYVPYYNLTSMSYLTWCKICKTDTAKRPKLTVCSPHFKWASVHLPNSKHMENQEIRHGQPPV